MSNNNSYFICIYNLIKNSILDLYISFIKHSEQPSFIFLLACTLLFVSITQIINSLFFFYPTKKLIFFSSYLQIFLLLSLIRTALKTIHPKTSLFLFYCSKLFLLLSLSDFVINGFIITPFPLIDKYLHLFDQALHFNTLQLLTFMHHHQLLQIISWDIYSSLIFLFFLIPLFLFATNHHQEAQDFLNHLILSVLISGIFYYFFPSTDPATVLHSPYFTKSQRYIITGFNQIHTLFQDTSKAYPFLSAPSAHTIWALLLAYACRNIIYLNKIIGLWAILVILTTLTTGWHFLADIILAIGITAGIIWLNNLKFRFIEKHPNRMANY